MNETKREETEQNGVFGNVYDDNARRFHDFVEYALQEGLKKKPDGVASKWSLAGGDYMVVDTNVFANLGICVPTRYTRQVLSTSNVKRNTVTLIIKQEPNFDLDIQMNEKKKIGTTILWREE